MPVTVGGDVLAEPDVEQALVGGLLTWQPTRPTLIDDLDKGFYFER